MITLRYAVRSLARSKGFVAVSVLALALGLGLSTTMFAVLDAIVHPYVAYRDPDSLFRTRWWYTTSSRVTQTMLVQAFYDAMRDYGTVVQAGIVQVSLETADDSRDVSVAQVTPEFFSVTGVAPRMGHVFTDGDGPSVVILSDGLWRRLFPRRTTLDSATIILRDRVYTVIGVMPRGSIAPGFVSAWVPRPAGGDSLSWGVPFIRLKPGVKRDQVDVVLKALSERLTAMVGDRTRPVSVELADVMWRKDEIRDIHKAMVGAALVVLIIACVNLAHLMLARGLAKRRELALRMALGASRGVIVRQMFLECGMITAAGAGLGALGATWGVHVLNNRMSPEISWVGLIQPQLSWRVFALSAAAAVISAVLFGLIPAVRVALGVSLDEPLKDGAGTTGRQRGRYSTLVIAEVGLALVLMMGGGLLLRTVQKMRRVQYTYDARSLVRADVSLRRWDDTAHAIRRDGLLELMRGTPGVKDVAFSTSKATLGGSVTAEMTSGDSTRTITEQRYPMVSANYFRVHGLRIIEGRDFEPGDEGTLVAILNAAGAKQLYPHGSAVGRMVKLGSPPRDAPWARIIGVVRNASVIEGQSNQPTPAEIYLPGADQGFRWGQLLVRGAGEDPRLAVEVRRRLHSAPNVWVYNAESPAYQNDAELRSRQFLANVFVTMGTVALGLAALGLYGVLAYAVGQRMREFAVRLALGAQPVQLFRMVMHDGAVMILAGTGIGAFGALAASRLLNAVLEQVLPSDVISLVACEIILMSCGFLAAYVPAQRAVRANPLEILRAV